MSTVTDRCRNGSHVPRGVATASGTSATVNDERVDHNGQRNRFPSAGLSAWTGMSPGVAEVLPLLYVDGLSSVDSVPALWQFVGSTADLSASSVTRLTTPLADRGAQGTASVGAHLPIGSGGGYDGFDAGDVGG